MISTDLFLDKVEQAVIAHRSSVDYGLGYVIDRTKLINNIYHTKHNLNRYIAVDYRFNRNYRNGRKYGAIILFNEKEKAMQYLNIKDKT